MAEDADIERVAIDLTLGIQADILIDLASGFARINHVAAAETVRTIEEKIVRDLRERATGLRARGLSAEGIAQVAGYLTDTIKEAREKMAEGETTLRSPSGGIFSRIFEFLVELLLGLHERWRSANSHMPERFCERSFQHHYAGRKHNSSNDRTST
jgi:hypothetical protein